MQYQTRTRSRNVREFEKSPFGLWTALALLAIAAVVLVGIVVLHAYGVQ